jgi:ABC-2 type transport system ATP-binding protein
VALVSARGLTKSYGSVRALDGATFEIGEGATGLLGSNGAGKTTSLKLFMGLIKADSGAVEVLGANPTASPEYRARIGYAPEHDCLPRNVSAAEFLAYLGEVSGLPRTAARLRASDVLRHVGLFEERYRPIGTYSTGMKQKVKLAQALVHDPVIAFLDEPTAGLDPMGRRDMLELIRHVGREFGISIVISTHLMGDVERTCDAVVVLDAGRVLRTGAVSGLTEETEAVLVDVVDAADTLAAALERRGLAVQANGNRLTLPRVSADDYDTLRDAIVETNVLLYRLAPERHTLADVFIPSEEATADGSNEQP